MKFFKKKKEEVVEQQPIEQNQSGKVTRTLGELLDELEERCRNEKRLTDIINLNFRDELKFHRVLYYLYGLYFAKFGEELFIPEFEAWRSGPIERNYRYSWDRARDKFLLTYEAENLEMLQGYLLYLISFDSQKLSEESRKTAPYKTASGRWISWKIYSYEIQEYFIKALKK